MRKRNIIACIVTFIILLLTNNFWLHSKPVDLKFDISGNGRVEIEAQLSNKFTKSSTVKKTVNIHELSHVKLKIDDIKTFCNLKIVVNSALSGRGNRLKVKNTRLQRGKYKPDASKIKIENNSAENMITYTYPVKGRASMSFEFEIFVIILVLGYLLSYKLIDYLADFKTIKEKLRLEILFLTLFFILLFIPMSHIDNVSTVSKAENRTLAKWSPLILKDNKINYNFEKDFDSWYDDRFYLRQLFLNISDIKLFLSKNWMTKDVMKGSNGWLFLGWKRSVDSYTNSILFSKEELASIDGYLGSIDNYCKMNKKNFYFVIAPDKSRIYPEHYPKGIKKVSDISRTNQLIDYIKNNFNVKVFYPKDMLVSKKGKNLLYWKHDTHWNLLGAYYGYLELMNMIVKDYNKINVYNVDQYETENHTGDLYNMSPALLRKVDDTVYTIPKIDYSSRCKLPEEPRGIVKCTNSNSKIDLLMFRDSFATSLIPYLSYTFRQSEYIWQRDVNPNVMKNANIIILEVVERDLPRLVEKKWNE